MIYIAVRKPHTTYLYELQAPHFASVTSLCHVQMIPSWAPLWKYLARGPQNVPNIHENIPISEPFLTS